MSMMRARCWWTLVVAAGCLGACSRTPSQPAPSPSEISGETHVYTARGEITALPSPDNFRAELRIHHEHIAEFRGKSGEVHVNPDGVPGMKAMDMPFPSLGPGVSLEGLEIGDKVEFELTVSHHPRITYAITRLSKLPPETEISYENKTSP
jgi:hypothetical protein